jgi:tRNA (guanine-N7-)-methyltransferase
MEIRPPGAWDGSKRLPQPRHPLVEFELDPRALFAEPDPASRWAAAFGAPRPLRIEIGVGNSDFLIEVALRQPGFNYLGFEYSPKRVAKFLRRVRLRGLETIRVARLDAAAWLADLVAPASVDRFFINFPDPWPKHRHAKHRLIQPATAALFGRLLVPGGGISLRTDSTAYADQMLSVLDAAPGLVNLSGKGAFAPSPLAGIATAYEVKYRREGRPIFYLEYRRNNE